MRSPALAVALSMPAVIMVAMPITAVVSLIAMVVAVMGMAAILRLDEEAAARQGCAVAVRH